MRKIALFCATLLLLAAVSATDTTTAEESTTTTATTEPATTTTTTAATTTVVTTATTTQATTTAATSTAAPTTTTTAHTTVATTTTTAATTTSTNAPTTTTTATTAATTAAATNGTTTTAATTTTAGTTTTHAVVTNTTTVPQTTIATNATTTAIAGTTVVGCTEVKPLLASASGGTTITLSLSGFASAVSASVKVNGQSCTNLKTDNPASITCVAPPNLGEGVVVVTIDNVAYTCPGTFKYTNPTISSITPARVPQGRSGITLTIDGSFGDSAFPLSMDLVSSTQRVSLTPKQHGTTQIQADLDVLPVAGYALNINITGYNGAFSADRTNALYVLDASVPVTVTLAAYPTVASFDENARRDFALRVAYLLQDDSAAVFITGVQSGSVVITFVLLTADNTLNIETLRSAIVNGQFKNTFPSAMYASINNENVIIGELSSPSPEDQNNNIPKYAIALIVIFCVLGLGICGILVFRMRRRHRRELPLTTSDRKDTQMI